ncbi:N-lysine methyltransferase KMT5A-A-like [Ostrea edulis]|uniref:N-lysine methyltransferase KMT5A-A-like n=1 Tax=Ostrea edulis TaxID=37623 RepID=UPI0024AF69E5|nr:N-lysine methyltransferase KMT5A-A-like [Ostrea edulis]
MAAYSRGKIALKRSLQARMQCLKKQRISPKAEAEFMCRSGLDSDLLKVKYINRRIGYGVFASENFSKGSFLTEYVGERIAPKEAEERDRKRKIKHCYLFYYKWNGLRCVDATGTDRIGKYINDAKNGDPLNNCVMKLLTVENNPRLCLSANRNIERGEELRYDYGETNLPWRQVCDKLFISIVF